MQKKRCDDLKKCLSYFQVIQLCSDLFMFRSERLQCFDLVSNVQSNKKVKVLLEYSAYVNIKDDKGIFTLKDVM